MAAPKDNSGNDSDVVETTRKDYAESKSNDTALKESGENIAETSGGFLSKLRGDLPASLVVFLVAVPLSLGIALASGAPNVVAGLIAAVVGGIVAGAVGGAPLQVSGPAAGLTVVVFEVVEKFGWPATCAITVMAGLVQLALGSLKIARTALAISPAVVHGMLAGIGIVITLAQLHVVLGDKPEASALKNLQALPGEIMGSHPPAVILGLITIGILWLWSILPAKIRLIPAALVAVTVGTLISLSFGDYFSTVTRIDLPDNLIGSHVWPDFTAIKNWHEAIISVLTIAIIASVESLLCAVATDKLHNGKRANLDRELIGQGAANTISGALGGLPVTGVIVRSSANIAAGGKSNFSAMLHGLWIILFVALLAGLLEKIPLAVLAGLLVYVGVQLVNPKHIREVFRHREAPVYFITVAGVVFLNLLEGVIIGIAVAIFLALRRMGTTEITVEGREAVGDRRARWHVRIGGSLTFLSVPNLSAELAKVPAGADVDVDLAVDFMDHAAFEAIHEWRKGQERTGGHVDLDETHEDWYTSAEEGRGRHKRSTLITGLSHLWMGRSRRSLPATETAEGGERTMPSDTSASPLLAGAATFNAKSAVAARPSLTQLAKGQEPLELFITCSDSRVVPMLFTSSGPGDLFKLRNVGNLVPPFKNDPDDQSDNSVVSAVEYSLGALGVQNIVVCGHTSCGAMQALLAGGAGETMPHVNAWLRHGEKSIARFNRGDVLDGSIPPVDQLSQLNVLEQLENLKAYPTVTERLENGTLQLIGLFFDIENAKVLRYEASINRFVPIETENHRFVPSPPAVAKAVV